MSEQRPAPSSARQLIERLAVPSPAAGLESLGTSQVESSPMLDAQQRLEAARRVLKQLAAGNPDVDEAVVDKIIQDAEEALRKLDGDRDGANLADSEVFGLEAVIESDGSRPVLFVKHGSIDVEASELQESLAAGWQAAAASFIRQINNVVAGVGGVQLPAFNKKRIGTAFAIAPGFVVTNRHVLEQIAALDQGRWTWIREAEVDFVGEHQEPRENRFKLENVVLTGPSPINSTINFAHLDIAVIRVSGDLSKFPQPLSFDREVDHMTVRDDNKPPIYVVGFPAKPLLASGEPEQGVPVAGHEYQEVLEKLYQNRFGSKRWAPGLVQAGAGQLSGDTRNWVMSHDASTLGGNSGSCVVDFANNGERVVGLHFGGRPRVENYAHIVAALQSELASLQGVNWM